MAGLLASTTGILMIIIMVAVGYVLAAKGWFNEDSTRLVAKLVTQVALPPYMIVSVTKDFSKRELVALLPDLRYPVISMLLLMVIAWGMVGLLHIEPGRRGLFTSMFFNSNTVFVGLPINMAIFGSKSLPYVLVYYMANTTIFWTIGVYFIQRDGQIHERLNVKTVLKKVFSAPLLGFMLGVLLVLWNVRLPYFLNQTFGYLGGLTVPLSMIFIGIFIYQAGLKNMRFDLSSAGVLFGRFIAAPALMLLLVQRSGMPVMMKQVFVLQSCMPVMTNAPVVAKLYHADADFAAVMVTETTLLSLVVVSVMMSFISKMV